MICLVHKNGIGVVIYRDVDRSASRKLNARGRAATACEIINDKLAEKAILFFG